MLFKDVNTFEIVSRPHKHNAEVLDNLLEPVSDVDLCLYLQHSANTNFSYNVIIKEENYSDIIWTKYASTLASNAKLFFKIILKSDLQEYIKLNNYTFVEISKIKENDNSIKPLLIMPPKPIKGTSSHDDIPNNEPKLKRANESSIRTFFNR